MDCYSKFRKSAVTFFVFVLITIFASQLYAQADNKTKSLNFLVISDMGGKASLNQKSVANAMALEAEKAKAIFVLTLGDNYHDDGIPNENDPRWKTEFEDVYNQPSLQIQWYPSLGNHDYRGSAEGEIKYSKLSNRWKMPYRYYSKKEMIDGTDSLLIVHLDTTPFVQEYYDSTSVYYKHVLGQNTQKQLHWLDSTLSAKKHCWVIVVGHHPIYSSAPKHGDTKELIEQVLPILKKHDVKIYMCGHDHVLQHIQRENFNYFICGGGAGFRDVSQSEYVKFGVGSLGFVSAIVTNEVVSFTYINSESKTLYSYSISK